MTHSIGSTGCERIASRERERTSRCESGEGDGEEGEETHGGLWVLFGNGFDQGVR